MSKSHFALQMLALQAILLSGCEVYSEQAHALAKEINDELISSGFCKTSHECRDVLPMYGEYGGHVYFNFYDIQDADKRKMFSVVARLVVSQGLEITKGVAITISAFPMPHEKYINFKNRREPAITLHVMQ